MRGVVGSWLVLVVRAEEPVCGCVGWRQTGGCDPAGRREPHGDKACDAVVSPGASGYCECSDGSRARKVTCDHRPFSCRAECARTQEYTCVMWRQTGACSPDGPREPQNDKTCDQKIAVDASGYCECGGDRRVQNPGCAHGTTNLEPFTCREACESERDFYQELGLAPNADSAKIKSAFRKLSLKYHPDKVGGDPAAKQRFEAVREAYDVLSNEESRTYYDIGGAQLIEAAKNNKLEKDGPSSVEWTAPLQTMYNGGQVSLAINRKVICRGCAGSNSARCNQCKERCANEVETVQMRMGPMIFNQQQEVASKERCKMVSHTIVVNVERGMAAGQTVTFKALGEQRPKRLPGDVVVKLKQEDHAKFKRRGDDLHMNIDISLKQGLVGFQISFMHLDGRQVFLKIDGMTAPGEVKVLQGEGMPKYGDPTTVGNLYIKCNYVMPKKLSTQQIDWLKANFPDA
mmetsp:Transcript_12930/g.32326  ORF Transcript_12930/g.32326 Transcript_12930/m.32326 type:complete len:459 (-) Transcript_12930:53-1429(-)